MLWEASGVAVCERASASEGVSERCWGCGNKCGALDGVRVSVVGYSGSPQVGSLLVDMCTVQLAWWLGCICQTTEAVAEGWWQTMVADVLLCLPWHLAGGGSTCPATHVGQYIPDTVTVYLSFLTFTCHIHYTCTATSYSAGRRKFARLSATLAVRSTLPATPIKASAHLHTKQHQHFSHSIFTNSTMSTQNRLMCVLSLLVLLAAGSASALTRGLLQGNNEWTCLEGWDIAG